jgi:hypothetical protein
MFETIHRIMFAYIFFIVSLNNIKAIIFEILQN